jgi:hypothetical protein
VSKPESIYEKLGRQHQAQAQRVILWFILPLTVVYFLWDLASGDPGRKTIPVLVLMAVGLPLGAVMHWRERRSERNARDK